MKGDRFVEDCFRQQDHGLLKSELFVEDCFGQQGHGDDGFAGELLYQDHGDGDFSGELLDGDHGLKERRRFFGERFRPGYGDFFGITLAEIGPNGTALYFYITFPGRDGIVYLLKMDDFLLQQLVLFYLYISL